MTEFETGMLITAVVLSGIGIAILGRGLLFRRANQPDHVDHDDAPPSPPGTPEINPSITVTPAADFGPTITVAPGLNTTSDASSAQDLSPSSALTYWLGRPPSLGDAFVGRTNDIAALDEAFKEHNAVAISGGAGTGKTRIAAEYAHHTNQPGFWTAAGATVDQILVALAPHIGVKQDGGGDEDIAREVRQRIATLSPDTLWVVDNLEDIDHVTPLLETVSGLRLLVTTRDARSNRLFPSVGFHAIDVLANNASIALLRSRDGARHAPDDPALADLAQAVDHLPLALEMLAVRLGEPRQTPARLLSELKEAPTPLQLNAFEEIAGISLPRPGGVFAAIVGSLDAVPEETRAALSLLGYTADAPISEALVAALTGLSDSGLDALLASGQRQSILSWAGSTVTLRSLTASAIVATNPDGFPSIALERARSRMMNINLDDPVAFRAELPHYERILGWARIELDVADPHIAAFTNALANGYWRLGQVSDSVLLLEETLETQQRVLAPGHPDTLTSRSNLAISYRALGRYEEAVALDEETLGMNQRILGPDHPDTLRRRSSLAAGYRALGRTTEAVAIDEETLKTSQRVLGPEHPGTLASGNNLANDYSALDRTSEAVTLHEETLEIRQRVLGPDHPDTLASRNNLALSYRALNRTEEAVALDEVTLEIRQRILGPDHPDTIQSRSNLAIGYLVLGRAAEAATLNEETLEIMKRILGPEDPATLNNRNNLAADYHTLGRHEEAVAIDDETLEINRRVLGPVHPSTLASRNNLALGYRALGRTEEAVAMDEETLEIRKRVLGPEHPDTLISRGNLAIGYRALDTQAPFSTAVSSVISDGEAPHAGFPSYENERD